MTGWAEVAVGAGGRTHRALSPEGWALAVKVLHVKLDDPARSRLDLERAAIQRLPVSPYVVPVVGGGWLDDGRAWLAGPWIDGGSLGDRVADQGALPVDLVVQAGIDAAEGLAELHAAGAIHSRIHPGNLLVAADRTALADIAVSAVLADEARNGRPQRHTPPEVLEGRPWAEAGDVYSLGSTLFTLLAGRSPFEREAQQGVPQLLVRLLGGPPPDLRRADVSPSLAAVVAAAIEPGAGRTPSAPALAAGLRAVDGHATPPTATELRRLATVLPGDLAPVGPAGTPLGSGYLLHEPVGAGAMGEVWRGSRTTDGGDVAVKVLRSELTSSPEVVTRFLQERTTLVGVDHPNVVRIHDMVAEGATLAIVMELVDGPDLRRWSAAMATLPPSTACSLLSQLCRGLAAVHRKGIIHRDLKPENVLIEDPASPTPRARLTDFGVARSAAGPVLTATGTLVGTPEYLAPELAAGRPASPASDIYAVGVMAYELLSGTRPFAADHPAALLRLHLEQQPASPPGLDPGLWSLLASCLDKDPAKRPTAEALGARFDALASSLAGLPALPPLTVAPVLARAEQQAGEPVASARPSNGPPPWATPSSMDGSPPGFAPPIVAAVPSEPVPALQTNLAVEQAPRAPAPIGPAPRRGWLVPAVIVLVALLGATTGVVLALHSGSRKAAKVLPTTTVPAPLRTTSVPIAVEVVPVAEGVIELRFEALDATPGFQFYVVGRGDSPKQVPLPKGATTITERGIDPDTRICWKLAAVFSGTDPPPKPPKPPNTTCLNARP